MQSWLKGATIALASAAIALAGARLMQDPAAGQTSGADVLRTADGRPDLNGIWQAVGTAHWNLQDHQARTGPVLNWAPPLRFRPVSAWSRERHSVPAVGCG